LALAPAIFILGLQLAALAFAAAGGASGTVEAAILGLWAGAAMGLVAPLVLLVKRQHPTPSCLLSLAATFCALLLGFAVWSEAAAVACHGRADCPFG